MTKKSLFIGMFMFTIFLCHAQENKIQKTFFYTSLELNTKYVWRGTPFGDAPTIFPSIGLQYKNIAFSATGGYAFNGSHSEVDLFFTYNISDFTFGLGDYFFPIENETRNQYLNYKSKETPHTIEAYITYNSRKLPIWITASTYVYGNDRDKNGNNYYSSYVEFGYYWKLSENNKLSLILGLTPMEGFYSDKFNIVNTAVKYDSVVLLGKYKIPISGSFILNPNTEKVFLSLSVYLSK
ncbi:hypothetical protein [Bacteroides sp.]